MDATDGCLVLLVDDDPDTRSMYAEYLRLSGFEVAQARNGHEALDLCQSVPPDVVVTDIQMPRMGGIQLIRSLRSRPATGGVPVICVSASVDCVREAAAVGCAAALEKPCPPDTLADLIRRVLGRRTQAAGGGHRDSDASGTPRQRADAWGARGKLSPHLSG
jgi:hypothetical protein